MQTDFLVVSADLITDLPLHHMIDLHRSRDATVTTLLFETPKGEDGKKAKVDPGGLLSRLIVLLTHPHKQAS